MKIVRIYATVVLALVATTGGFAFPIIARNPRATVKPRQKTEVAKPRALQLRLPSNFHADIFADNLGTARHLAVTSEGIVYVKLGKLKNGKGVIVLEDING